jgi:CARDB
MRKLVWPLSFLLLAAPAAAQTVPTRASLESCHTGAAALDRFAVFTAQMGATSQSKRMLVRFDLLQRVPGDDYHRVQAPGLGVWRSSIPGVDIFRYRKQVANLEAPGSYRAFVRFRWLDASGKVIAGATRRTRTCRQPDLRPDLSVGALTAQPAANDRARYTVLVRNEGRTPTSAFTVGFVVGDQTQPTQSVQSLVPGETRVLSFAGPRCNRANPVRVTVDPDLAVDEADETNNSRTVVCPL